VALARVEPTGVLFHTKAQPSYNRAAYTQSNACTIIFFSIFNIQLSWCRHYFEKNHGAGITWCRQIIVQAKIMVQALHGAGKKILGQALL